MHNSLGKKILIVDDDKTLLKMVRSGLMFNGFDVVTAETGEEGIKLAAAEDPDLIILDVILPGLKGREVCAQLKEEAKTKTIPVIFLTSKNSPDDVQAEMAAGGIMHITKPVNMPKLVEEVKKILKVS